MILVRTGVRRMRRPCTLTFAVVLCLGYLARPSYAQNEKRSEVVNAAGDRFTIHFTYWPALEDKNPTGLENAPVVILLHGQNGSRLIWDRSSAPPGGKPFAQILNENAGYAVVSVDLRKHGESLPDGQSATIEPNDYTKMAAGDLPAIKEFLVAEHEAKKLNINKLGIIAADMMCPVAAAFAEADWRRLPHEDGPGGAFGTPRGQDVRALVFLSPTTAASGRVNASRAFNFLKRPDFEIAVMVIAGTGDAADRNQSKSLYQVFSGIKQNEERCKFLQPNTNARGTDLLGNPAAQIEPPILGFLDEFVKQRESEWRTRKSRYDRDSDN